MIWLAVIWLTVIWLTAIWLSGSVGGARYSLVGGWDGCTRGYGGR